MNATTTEKWVQASQKKKLSKGGYTQYTFYALNHFCNKMFMRLDI